MTPLENDMSRYNLLFCFIKQNSIDQQKVTSAVLKWSYNCKDKPLVTCLMVSYDENTNGCLLSTPRMACVNFPNRFFKSFSQHLHRLFSTPPTAFPTLLTLFPTLSTGTQRVPNTLSTLFQRFQPFNGKE